MSSNDETESTQSKPKSSDDAVALAGGAVSEDNKKKDLKHRVEWSPENEEILVEWCDISQCYKWMHTRAQQMFSRLHAWFTIPAIVLSTISGTASFAQGNLPVAYQSYSPLAIGTLNIFIGVLTTIQQYLKISELNESYRVSSIAWDKYARNIRIELAKAPTERTDAYTFLKYSREEFDRLMETSPSIPPKVIAEFTKRFSGESMMGGDKVKMARFDKLKKPDICDIIISAEENRHPWYKEVEKARRLAEEQAKREADAAVEAAAEAARQAALAALSSQDEDDDDMERRMQRDLLKREEELRHQEQELRDKMRDLQERERQEKARAEEEAAATAKIKQAQLKKVQDFVAQFRTNLGREPLEEELTEHFDAVVLQEFSSMV
jgi:hypothetical protein